MLSLPYTHTATSKKVSTKLGEEKEERFPTCAPRLLARLLSRSILFCFVLLVARYSTCLPLFADAQAAGHIVNKLSGKCPTVWKWNTASPGRIAQARCRRRNSKAQMWTLKAVNAPGTTTDEYAYQIFAGHHKDLCMGILNGSKKMGAPLVQVKCDVTDPAQVFQVTQLSSAASKGTSAMDDDDDKKYYHLIPLSSTDKCVQVAPKRVQVRSRSIDLRMKQSSCNSTQTAQLWDIQAELVRPPPVRAVENGTVLKSLFNAFLTQGPEVFATTSFARIYGYPIGTWNVSQVTDMRLMESWLAPGIVFNGIVWDAIGSFNEDISNWDVSRVTTMKTMFTYAKSFNQDISTWDVRKVTDMESMFRSAASFNQDLSMWKVKRVADMGYMFRNAGAFNRDISRWDVRRVRNMQGMFEFAESFNQDISVWNVGRVADMGGMFSGAGGFNQNLCSWGYLLDKNATNIGLMFGGETYSVPAKSCPDYSQPDLGANPPGPFCHICD